MGLFGSKPKIDRRPQDFAEYQAYLTRAEEKAREQRTRFGLGQLDAIFDGGKYRKTYEQSLPYEISKAKNGWLAPGYGIMLTDDREKAERHLARHRPMPKLTGTGPMQTSKGFGGLVDARREANRDYYRPQLEDKFGDARDDLTFALSRAGLLDSTAAGGKTNDLNRDYGVQQGQIESRANADATRFQSQIADTRSALETQLRASGDPSSALNAALSRADIFRTAKPEFSPLGDLFAGAAEGIGQGVDAYRTGQLNRRVRNWRDDPFGDRGRVVK